MKTGLSIALEASSDIRGAALCSSREQPRGLRGRRGAEEHGLGAAGGDLGDLAGEVGARADRQRVGPDRFDPGGLRVAATIAASGASNGSWSASTYTRLTPSARIAATCAAACTGSPGATRPNVRLPVG